jgi:hypothetical protein
MKTSDLVRLADAYARHRSLSMSTVSTYVRNDGKFFDKLKGSSGCTLKTAAAVLKWFSDNWPVDLEWPGDLDRPSKAKRAA